MVECLPSMQEALVLFINTTKKKTRIDSGRTDLFVKAKLSMVI